ncbi:MAG TPA: ABC transporter permease subunit [Thermomicrobiales bacterium]|jgi:putative aldouronate transport system permease protein|nr:ABC transporter permease subunit [Thermomicrobiales bacterium]
MALPALANQRSSGTALSSTVPRPSLRKRIWANKGVYLFMLPGVLWYILFHYFPLLGNIIAFKDYSVFIGILDSPWVGFENFRKMFDDPDFVRALKNTLIIQSLQLVFAFPAPLLLALLLNSIVSDKVKRTIQSIVYLPHFLGWVIVISMWQQVFGGTGFVNQVLMNQGFDRVNIMSNPDTFYGLVVAQSIWKEVGWGTIIFLAALTKIDVQLYEAAVIDGANGFKRMLTITLPGIRSIIVLLLILRLGSMMSVGFEQYFLQRNAVGAQVSEVLDTLVYTRGIGQGDWSFAAAVGLANSVVGAFLIFVSNYLAKKFFDEGIF